MRTTNDDPKAVAKRFGEALKDNHIPLHAAGLAFWGFLAVFPALIAIATVYAMVASPGDVQSQVQSLIPNSSSALQEVLTNQLSSLTQGGSTWGLLLSLAGVIWATSTGVSHLLKTLTVSTTEHEPRDFVPRRLVSIAWALVAIVVGAATVFVIGFSRSAGSALLSSAPWLVPLLSWLVLLAIGWGVVTAVYRYGPHLRHPTFEVSATAAGIATGVWALASLLFALYLRFFGVANAYGALGGVIAAMLWFYLSAVILLAGALATRYAVPQLFDMRAADDDTVGYRDAA